MVPISGLCNKNILLFQSKISVPISGLQTFGIVNEWDFIEIFTRHYFWSKNPQIPLYSCKYQVQQRKTFKTIVSNVFGERHAPYTQNTSFVDFVKLGHCSHNKRLNLSSLSNSQYFFSDNQKTLTPDDPSIPSYLYTVVFIYYRTCSRPE